MDPAQDRAPETVNHKVLRAKWVFVAFAAIAAYFLVAEHRAHLTGLLGFLPLLLLLACPLLHAFMHGRHRGHTHKGRGHDVPDAGETR